MVTEMYWFIVNPLMLVETVEPNLNKWIYIP